MQTPCVLMRGGTSKGPFFLASDLPQDPQTRDAVLLSAMGSPHEYQVDGIGGGQPLSSKVAIISRSRQPGVDIDYLFAQVLVNDRNSRIRSLTAGIRTARKLFRGEALIPAAVWKPPAHV